MREPPWGPDQPDINARGIATCRAHLRTQPVCDVCGEPVQAIPHQPCQDDGDDKGSTW